MVFSLTDFTYFAQIFFFFLRLNIKNTALDHKLSNKYYLFSFIIIIIIVFTQSEKHIIPIHKVLCP